MRSLGWRRRPKLAFNGAQPVSDAVHLFSVVQDCFINHGRELSQIVVDNFNSVLQLVETTF
ncbi:MAG: hypothetical protein FJ118_03370 [Deltaproteobacteria bacterium]|nr:hypothetical protein [Deltaproteobacteria bacterium]